MALLIVEDDISLNRTINEILQKEGYVTFSTECHQGAIDIFLNNKIDLILLDIGLPDGDGIDFCKNVRQTSKVPILFLTANDDEDVVVDGLNSGGDDYMTKPFRIKELLARIHSLLRRTIPQEQIKIGNLLIDFNRNEISKGDKKVLLTMIDFEIFKSIVINKRQILTREQLLMIMERDGQYSVEDNTLSVRMKRIREKIGTYNGMQYIETVRGIGYRMNLEVIYGDE